MRPRSRATRRAFFGNDVNHAARRAVAITRTAGPRRTSIRSIISGGTQEVHHGYRARHASPDAPSYGCLPLAVNQNQRVFRTHTANINLWLFPR